MINGAKIIGLTVLLWGVAQGICGAEKPVTEDNFLYYKKLIGPSSETAMPADKAAMMAFEFDDQIYLTLDDLQNGFRVFTASRAEPFYIKRSSENKVDPANIHSSRVFGNASGEFLEIEIMVGRRPVTAVTLGELPSDLSSRSVWLYGSNKLPDGTINYVRVPLVRYSISDKMPDVVLAQGASLDMLRFESLKVVMQNKHDLDVATLSPSIVSAIFQVCMPTLNVPTAKVYYGGPAPDQNYGLIPEDDASVQLIKLTLGQEASNKTFVVPYQPGSYRWIFVSLLVFGGVYLVFCIIRSLPEKAVKSA